MEFTDSCFQGFSFPFYREAVSTVRPFDSAPLKLAAANIAVSFNPSSSTQIIPNVSAAPFQVPQKDVLDSTSLDPVESHTINVNGHMTTSSTNPHFFDLVQRGGTEACANPTQVPNAHNPFNTKYPSPYNLPHSAASNYSGSSSSTNGSITGTTKCLERYDEEASSNLDDHTFKTAPSRSSKMSCPSKSTIIPSWPNSLPVMSTAPPRPKGTGTDPNKYKTAICRNWEKLGACSFRGCTFAHGQEDLRFRSGNDVPHVTQNGAHMMNGKTTSVLDVPHENDAKAVEDLNAQSQLHPQGDFVVHMNPMLHSNQMYSNYLNLNSLSSLNLENSMAAASLSNPPTSLPVIFSHSGVNPYVPAAPWSSVMFNPGMRGGNMSTSSVGAESKNHSINPTQSTPEDTGQERNLSNDDPASNTEIPNFLPENSVPGTTGSHAAPVPGGKNRVLSSLEILLLRAQHEARVQSEAHAQIEYILHRQRVEDQWVIQNLQLRVQNLEDMVHRLQQNINPHTVLKNLDFKTGTMDQADLSNVLSEVDKTHSTNQTAYSQSKE